MEDVATRTRGRVAANGIELAYETFGDPAAPPVVLIMGLATQMIAWPDPMCEGLARRDLFVVRFDNRDVGESTHLRNLPPPRLAGIVVGRTPPPYSISDMAADVAGLIDGLGLGQVHLVGASMGSTCVTSPAGAGTADTTRAAACGSSRRARASRTARQIFTGSRSRHWSFTGWMTRWSRRAGAWRSPGPSRAPVSWGSPAWGTTCPGTVAGVRRPDRGAGRARRTAQRPQTTSRLATRRGTAILRRQRRLSEAHTAADLRALAKKPSTATSEAMCCPSVTWPAPGAH